jgi:hypothetical protein
LQRFNKSSIRIVKRNKQMNKSTWSCKTWSRRTMNMWRNAMKNPFIWRIYYILKLLITI